MPVSATSAGNFSYSFMSYYFFEQFSAKKFRTNSQEVGRCMQQNDL